MTKGGRSLPFGHCGGAGDQIDQHADEERRDDRATTASSSNSGGSRSDSGAQQKQKRRTRFALQPRITPGANQNASPPCSCWGWSAVSPDFADAAVAAVATDHAKTFTRDDEIALGLSLGPPNPAGTPGYSTTNIIIMGVVEKLTGRTPEELVNDVFAGGDHPVEPAVLVIPAAAAVEPRLCRRSRGPFSSNNWVSQNRRPRT